MLGFGRGGERALVETTNPWAFRPGDFVTRERETFEITRVARRHWLQLRRRPVRYVVYGMRLSDDALTISTEPGIARS